MCFDTAVWSDLGAMQRAQFSTVRGRWRSDQAMSHIEAYSFCTFYCCSWQEEERFFKPPHKVVSGPCEQDQYHPSPPPPREISQTRLQKGGIGNNLIDSQCWIRTLNDRATYQTKWFFKGEESGGDFVGDLMLFGWEEIKDSWLHPLETDCWGAVPGQLFLAWQLFALQEGNCGRWMFPSPPPEHILEFAPPPSDSWPWLQATGILSSLLPHGLWHVSCPWLKSLCSPATIGGDRLSEGDSWFGDKGCKELMLCPLNPAVWLPVGLLKDEEILLQLPYPDLQKVQKECSKEYIEQECNRKKMRKTWDRGN